MKHFLRVPQRVLGIFFSLGIGLVAITLRSILSDPLFDSLFLLLAAGIYLNFFFESYDDFLVGIKKVLPIFILIGVVVSGALSTHAQDIISFRAGHAGLTFFIVVVLTAFFDRDRCFNSGVSWGGIK